MSIHSHSRPKSSEVKTKESLGKSIRHLRIILSTSALWKVPARRACVYVCVSTGVFAYTYVHASMCISLRPSKWKPLQRQWQGTCPGRWMASEGLQRKTEADRQSLCSPTWYLCHQLKGATIHVRICQPLNLCSLQTAGISIPHLRASVLRWHAEILQALNQKDYFSAWYGSENLRRVQGNKIKTLPTKLPPYSLN